MPPYSAEKILDHCVTHNCVCCVWRFREKVGHSHGAGQRLPGRGNATESGLFTKLIFYASVLPQLVRFGQFTRPDHLWVRTNFSYRRRTVNSQGLKTDKISQTAYNAAVVECFRTCPNQYERFQAAIISFDRVRTGCRFFAHKDKRIGIEHPRTDRLHRVGRTRSDGMRSGSRIIVCGCHNKSVERVTLPIALGTKFEKVMMKHRKNISLNAKKVLGEFRKEINLTVHPFRTEKHIH